MELRAIFPLRRMVRHYRPDPVPREVVERIVETVRSAPSAGYSQGQRLLVLTEPEARAASARILGPGRDGEALEPWFDTAPVHVLVCTREDDYHDRYREPDKLQDGDEIEWPVPYWFVDAGAALMLLLLAAVDEGLAAGVSGVPLDAADELRSVFDIPEDVSIVVVVTLGRAAPDPGWSAVTSRRTQRRRQASELVRWERWS